MDRIDRMHFEWKARATTLHASSQQHARTQLSSAQNHHHQSNHPSTTTATTEWRPQCPTTTKNNNVVVLAMVAAEYYCLLLLRLLWPRQAAAQWLLWCRSIAKIRRRRIGRPCLRVHVRGFQKKLLKRFLVAVTAYPCPTRSIGTTTSAVVVAAMRLVFKNGMAARSTMVVVSAACCCCCGGACFFSRTSVEATLVDGWLFSDVLVARRASCILYAFLRIRFILYDSIHSI